MLNLINVLFDHSRSASPALPVSKSSTTPAHSLETKPEDCNLEALRRSVKVLLVSTDDCFSIRVRSYLRLLGFSVFTCSSPERAESLFLERRDIDIWLIDLHSLGLEALCLAMKVRNQNPENSIILVSGAQESDNTLQPLLLRSWTRIRKPVDLPELLQIIHKALSSTSHAPRAKKQGEDWDALGREGLTRLRRSRPQDWVLN